MKEETRRLLASADRHLGFAERTLNGDTAPVAARESYLAAFHAAQALIYERSGRIAKTHSGTRAKFNELTRETALPAEIRRFLADAFELKTSADYDVSELPRLSEARDALDKARRFVAAIRRLLGG